MINAIVIDQREPNWVKNLCVDNVPVANALLEAGDAWLMVNDDLIVVERKTPQDLLGSIKDDRIFSQAAACRALTPWAYLVITGNLTPGPDGKVVTGHRPTGWDFEAVQGALLTVQELGLYVIYAKDNADYGPALRRLAARARTGTVTVNPARLIHVLSPGEAMLAALPGIGIERVRALLGHKQTPAQALAYLADMDDYEIPGIGETTKQAVCKALGLVPGSKIILDEVAF